MSHDTLVRTTTGLVFHGGEGDHTFTIERDALKGIDAGGVGVRRNAIPRPTGDGDFPTRGYRTGRQVSWAGLVNTSSPDDQQHALLRLRSWGADGELARLMFDTPIATLWADFYLVESPDVEILVFGQTARYMVRAYAPYPALYGTTKTYSTAEQLHHYGNRKAWPLVTVTGAGTGYSLTSQGRTFQVTTALPAGATDVVDMSTGGVKRNGATLIGGVGAARVWGVDPGRSVSWQCAGANATAAVTDTYI